MLCSLMTAFDLCEMFNEPTRITESTSRLDVFLTNSSCSFDTVFGVPSDHHIVMGTYLAQRSHQPCTHKVISARSCRKFDPALLCDFMIYR